jgi:hypothetical protein
MVTSDLTSHYNGNFIWLFVLRRILFSAATNGSSAIRYNLNPFYCTDLKLINASCTWSVSARIQMKKTPQQLPNNAAFIQEPAIHYLYVFFWNKALPHVVRWTGMRQCWITIFSHPTELDEASLPHLPVRSVWGSNELLPLIQLNEAVLSYNLKTNEAVSSQGLRLCYYLLRAQ